MCEGLSLPIANFSFESMHNVQGGRPLLKGKFTTSERTYREIAGFFGKFGTFGCPHYVAGAILLLTMPNWSQLFFSYHVSRAAVSMCKRAAACYASELGIDAIIRKVGIEDMNDPTFQ
jgi:hypothetical protein